MFLTYTIIIGLHFFFAFVFATFAYYHPDILKNDKSYIFIGLVPIMGIVIVIGELLQYRRKHVENHN